MSAPLLLLWGCTHDKGVLGRGDVQSDSQRRIPAHGRVFQNCLTRAYTLPGGRSFHP